MTLDPEKCRLVSPEQVKLFNDWDALLQEVRDGLPRVALRTEFQGRENPETKRLDGIWPDHEQLRERLLRPCYLVGLLGVTGAGKSTSLNSLVGETVLPQGSEGWPCTSVIQRIRFAPADSKPSIDLQFLDGADWWKRRKMLCDKLGFSRYASDDDDEELIAAVEKSLQESDENSNRETDNNLVAMQKFFLRFLLGRKFHSRRLESGHHLGPIELPDLPSLGLALDSVARHRDTAKDITVGEHSLRDSECALLREVFISIPAPKHSADLELVDLPGFLAGSGQDDVITKSYFDRLDGACVLLSAQNLGLDVFEKLRTELEERFKSLVGRVWLVVTKLDTIAKDGLHSPDKSIFHGIDRAVRNWNLRDTDAIYRHLLITSNEIYNGTRGKDQASTKATIAYALKTECDEAGNLRLPVPLRDEQRLEGVRRAFQHVLEDGGIGRLRRVIETELAQNVRDAVAVATHNDLIAAVERTIRAVEACRDQRGLTRADHDVAIAWSNLLRGLERRRDLVDELVAESLLEMRRRLAALLERYCPRDNLPDIKSLPLRHANLAKSLTEEATEQWVGDGKTATGRIGGIVGDAIRRLEDHLRSQARPDKLEGRSKNLEAVFKPLDSLAKFSEELVRRNPKHAGQFAELGCRDLFEEAWPPEVLPQTYREMMVRKIDNVIFEATHRLQNAIRSALAEAQSRLENLGRDESSATTDPVSRETYDRFVELLREFRARLGTAT